MSREYATPEGALDLSAAPQILIGFGAILVLVAGLFYWAVTVTITGAVIASGTVEVESNRQIVQHPVGGVVSTVLARDGQHVVAGDVLVVLDTARQRGELAFAQAQLFELAARQSRLQAEQARQPFVTFDADLIRRSNDNPTLAAILDGQRRLFQAAQRTITSETTKLKNLSSQIAAQMRGMDAQEGALMRQLDLIGQELVAQRSLRERKLTSASAVIDLEREEARLRGALGEVTANRAAAAERMAETDLELARIVTKYLENGLATARDLDAPIRQYQRDVQALRDQIAEAEIRAPVSGIVYGMTLRTNRAVLRPAEPLLYLIPQDRSLIVAMQVQPRQIDQVALGQRVKLRLSALDQRTTPEVWGQITQVSADVITDQKTGQTYFRAEVILPAEELRKLPEGVGLLPGMPVEAFIRTGEHSPMAYMLKPVADYFARAFRES